MITCALSSKQIEFLYSLTKQSISEKLKINKPFIVDDYMSYLYKRISDAACKDQASQFLAFTPTIIEQVVLNNFTPYTISDGTSNIKITVTPSVNNADITPIREQILTTDTTDADSIKVTMIAETII